MGEVYLRIPCQGFRGTKPSFSAMDADKNQAVVSRTIDILYNWVRFLLAAI